MARASKKDVGRVVKGRVCAYSNRKGYGFIYTEDGKDLFLSSYALGKSEKKVVVGTIIECTVAQYNNKIIAKDVRILEKYKDDIQYIDMPNGDKLSIKKIHKFGKSNAFERVLETGVTRELLEEYGYITTDLDYIFIDTANKIYTFFGKESPIKADGNMNLEEYYNYLCNTLIRL